MVDAQQRLSSPRTAGGSSRARASAACWRVSGYLPLGYYKDPEKTERTFHVFEGRRWSVPGDWATVEADGSLKLLGRGSQVINTGGEKVFPEEVEEAIKRYPGVRDAAVVGVPDARFGERICAVVDMGDRARRRPWPSSRRTCASTWRATRRRASWWWRRSSGPPTASSTTRACAPRP